MQIAPGDDTGLRSLALVSALLGQSLDLQQTARDFLQSGRSAEKNDIIRIARSQGFKARKERSSVKRVDAISLPVIACHQDGSFFVIGRRTDAGVLVGISGGPPTVWTIDELTANWSGDLIFVVRRDGLSSTKGRFGISWFLPVIKRFCADNHFGKPTVAPVCHTRNSLLIASSSLRPRKNTDFGDYEAN